MNGPTDLTHPLMDGCKNWFKGQVCTKMEAGKQIVYQNVHFIVKNNSINFLICSNLFDPGDEFLDPGVDAWLVVICTATTPAHNPNQKCSSFNSALANVDPQWASRITLKH